MSGEPLEYTMDSVYKQQRNEARAEVERLTRENERLKAELERYQPSSMNVEVPPGLHPVTVTPEEAFTLYGILVLPSGSAPH